MRRINVLQFICPDGYYGAERWIMAFAKHIDRTQINCQLAVTHESETQNIEIYERYQQLGLDAFKIEMQGRFDPLIIPRLARLIRQNKIDIIHTHGYKSDILGLIAARIAGIKAISTPHGFENSKDFKLQLFIKFGCFSLRYFDVVAPLSGQIKKDLLNFKIAADKIRLIFNGVDIAEVNQIKDRSDNQLAKKQNEKIIGYVGQLTSRKNVRDIIKTFDLFYRKHKNSRLKLVGDGPQKEELEKYAATLISANNIEFWGYHEERLRLLKEFDLFCMTSTLEGIPRAMMEAMAMQVPVIAYDIPGVDALIRHEQTGLLASPGNTEQLLECWESVLLNDEFRQTIARNGWSFVNQQFSAQRMSEEYTHLYNKLLNIVR